MFRIYVDTSYSTAVTSSYLTDIKLTKHNPSDYLPFSQIQTTGSTTFVNWYDDQYESASLYDQNNIHSFINTMPEFLQNDNAMDNRTFRKFVNMSGEHFGLIKNYIDNYTLLLKKSYDKSETVSDNLLPVLASQQGWQFSVPFGKKDDGNLLEYMGSTISNLNKNIYIYFDRD